MDKDFFKPGNKRKSQNRKVLHVFTDASFYDKHSYGGMSVVISKKANPKKDSSLILKVQSKSIDLKSSFEAELKAIQMAHKCIYEHNDSFLDYYKYICLYTDALHVKNSIIRMLVDNTQVERARPRLQEAYREIIKYNGFLLQKYRSITYYWVKGHSNIHLNEYCDRLAKKIGKSKIL